MEADDVFVRYILHNGMMLTRRVARVAADAEVEHLVSMGIARDKIQVVDVPSALVVPCPT